MPWVGSREPEDNFDHKLFQISLNNSEVLEKLTIRNYALISSLDITFQPGLTILTGETGAGKSIMLGALSLLLGGRADTRVIADGSAKSVVEALFTDVVPELKEYFDSNDLEWNDGEVIIRREISASGRSRAFINDRPVTLSILAGLSEQLIDIHSQHSNARINSPSVQLEIIDSMADNDELLREYIEEFASYVNLRAKIRRLRESLEKNRKNSEFMRFQLEQLDKLNPRKGELAEIEKRFELLSDADEIKENLTGMSQLIGGYEEGVLDRIAEARGLASKIDFTMFDSEAGEHSIERRLENAFVELKDICESLEDYAGSIDSNPAALARMSERMNQYYDAVKRFRVVDADGLIAMREDLRHKLDAIDNGDSDLPELEREAKAKGKVLKDKADLLTASRKKAASEFERILMETAAPLGLPNIRFEVKFEAGKLSPTGQDHVEFLCAFNKNQTPGAVARIASGGEISRLMLSMKCIMARHMNLPTIIFDEVDTGVSGDIADKMGNMMLDMSRDMQVMTITHLPQVAAKGVSHFKVYKSDGDDKTNTHVRPLSEEERVREIAGMISGSSISDAALDNARALLSFKHNK